MGMRLMLWNPHVFTQESQDQVVRSQILLSGPSPKLPGYTGQKIGLHSVQKQDANLDISLQNQRPIDVCRKSYGNIYYDLKNVESNAHLVN